MKLLIIIIFITFIILTLVFIKKNYIQSEPSKIYEKTINLIDYMDKNIDKKKKNLHIENKDLNMNYQDLENDFPVLLTNLEKNNIVKYNKKLLKSKTNLLKLLSIKDNLFKLKKKFKEKHSKIIDYVEENRDKAFDANIKINGQKKLIEKSLKFINNSIENKKKIEDDIEVLKMQVIEKEIKAQENQLKMEKKKVKYEENIKNTMSELTKKKNKFELSKINAIESSKKAQSEAIIAKTHKIASEKAAEAAESYRIKAKKESDALLAKSNLDKAKNELLNNKDILKNIADIKKNNETQYLEELKIEKEVIIKLKNELDDINNNIIELEKDIINKKGEDVLNLYKKMSGGNNNDELLNQYKDLIKKQKIAQLNLNNAKYLIKNMLNKFKNQKNNDKNNFKNNIQDFRSKLNEKLQIEKDFLKKQYDAEYSKKRQIILEKTASQALLRAKKIEKEQLEIIENSNKKLEQDKILQDEYDKQKQEELLLQEQKLAKQKEKEKLAALELEKLKEKQRLLKEKQEEEKKLKNKLIKFKPKNEKGYCSSTNKCKGINENSFCLGTDQPVGDGGCNSYCWNLGKKYYISDLEGCVNNDYRSVTSTAQNNDIQRSIIKPDTKTDTKDLNNYKLIKNAAIYGHNTKHLTNVSVLDCKKACDKEDWCNSFDYYKNQNKCDLSNAPKSTQLKTNYKNNPYDHYQKNESKIIKTDTKKELCTGMLKQPTNFNGTITNDYFGFNGFNNFINIPSNMAPQLANSDFTVEFWINVKNKNANEFQEGNKYYQTIYSQGTQSKGWGWATFSIALYYKKNAQNTTLYANCFGSKNSKFYLEKTNVSQGWQHIAITRDKNWGNQGLLAMYINGKLGTNTNLKYNGVAQTGTVDFTGSKFIADGPVNIGNNIALNNRFNNSSLKKLKVFNTVRTQQQIQQSAINSNPNEPCPTEALLYIPMNSKDKNMYYKKQLTPYDKLVCTKHSNNNYTLSNKNYNGDIIKTIDCNDGKGNSLWIKGEDMCNKVKSGELNVYDKGFGINRDEQTCNIKFNNLFCQKQNEEGFYTLSQNIYDGNKPQKTDRIIVKSCQDGKGNALWFNPKGHPDAHNDGADAFCEQVRSGKFTGYDKAFDINRDSQTCTTSNFKGGNQNINQNLYIDMSIEQSTDSRKKNTF